jgi:hypothetical protein
MKTLSTAEQKVNSVNRVKVTLVLPTPKEWQDVMDDQLKKGAEAQTNAIQDIWNDRALFWNVSLPRNAFSMLRNLVCMEYTPAQQDSDVRSLRRKRLRGPSGVMFPTPPREEQILQKIKQKEFDFILHQPLNIYSLPGHEQWKAYHPDGDIPNEAEFRGCIFHPADIFTKLGLEQVSPPFNERLEHRVISLFIWSDGGHVDGYLQSLFYSSTGRLSSRSQ